MLSSAASDASQQHRYHFNNTGVVRELIYPNKAILHFRLHGKEEKAILLSKVLTMDGKTLDESRLMSDIVKVNDVVEFDCHIYDKGGLGSGKDRCNYFAMRAWKNSKEYERQHGSGSGQNIPGLNLPGATASAATSTAASGHQASIPIQRNNMTVGTGWISELNPRKGVLTFDNHGRDERVLFLASKVWFFEKRLGARQPLTDVLSEGDPVQFEAVPQEAEDQSTNYCSWFANLVWKGRRPPIEDSGPSPLNSFPLLGADKSNSSRRASFGSTESAADIASSLLDDSYLNLTTLTNGIVNEGVIKGVGMIGKIINDKSGVIWWLRSANHLQSVWFESKQTFLYGTNLTDKNLLEIFNEGDPVTFLAEKPPANFPTKWVAKQVLITDSTASIVTKVIKNSNNFSTLNGSEEASKNGTKY